MSKDLKLPYQDHLNPKIWDGLKLKPEVLKQLRKISDKFIEWCDAPDMQIKDIVLCGSIANYNWDPKHSDIDIHIFIDLDDFKDKCGEFAEDFFDVKNKRFKEVFPTKIYGMPVEITVEDYKKSAVSLAIYSIKKGEWVKKPVYKKPKYDSEKAKEISDKWKKKFDDVIAKKDAKYDEIENVRDDFKDFRSKNLEKGGEFDPANIAFKHIRRKGLIDKAKAKAQKALSKELSLTKKKD